MRRVLGHVPPIRPDDTISLAMREGAAILLRPRDGFGRRCSSRGEHFSHEWCAEAFSGNGRRRIRGDEDIRKVYLTSPGKSRGRGLVGDTGTGDTRKYGNRLRSSQIRSAGQRHLTWGGLFDAPPGRGLRRLESLTSLQLSPGR